MRRLRYIPEGGALVEVTCRTVHSRFLLRPGLPLNDIVVGVLRPPQVPDRLCSLIRRENFHLTLDVADAPPSSPLHSYPTTTAGRLTRGWMGRQDMGRRRRYRRSGSHEAAARLRGEGRPPHAVKENLVERVSMRAFLRRALWRGAQGRLLVQPLAEYARPAAAREIRPQGYATLSL